MSDSKYEFATQILTLKSPYEAAAIVPHVLNSDRTLVQERLILWFSSYLNEFQRHNSELQFLLNEGATILGFDNSTRRASGNPASDHRKPLSVSTSSNPTRPEDLGPFNKLWNTFLRLVELEVASNDRFLKGIKTETLRPLKTFVTGDVRASELQINAQDLQEIARDLSGPNSSNSEYQWNAKAPQVFDNLENFETVKSQLLFDVILNYFNSQTSRFSKQSDNSANSVNYLLGTYNFDDEMKLYLKYLIGADFTSELTPLKPQNHATTSAHSPLKRLSSLPVIGKRHDTHSDLALQSLATSGGKKKPLKLKSRVGSIFGRKKKNSKFHGGHEAIIDENESVTSSIVAASTNRSTESLGNALNGGKRRLVTAKLGQQQSHPEHHESGNFQPQNSSAGVVHDRNTSGYSHTDHASNLAAADLQKSSNSAKSLTIDPKFVPSAPSHPSFTSPPLTPKKYDLVPPIPKAVDSPNVIKYDSSDEEDSVPMLRKHDLDAPLFDRNDLGDSLVNRKELNDPLLQKNEFNAPSNPVVEKPASREYLNTVTSTSASKYSFEAGDEDGPISTPNSAQPASRNVFDDALPEPNVNGSLPVKTATSGSIHGLGSGPAPPPPRKVAHKDAEPSVSRKDIKSQYFHNLPNARDSIVAPRRLVAQDTGASLVRNLAAAGDLFKHADELQVPGLNVSIAEVVNVSFKNDQIVRKQLIGEVAFNYIPHTDASDLLHPLTVTIPNVFDKTILNQQYVQAKSDNEYVVDTLKIVSKTLGGVKYLKKLDSVPILMHQVWKFEEHQASLLVSLKLNPDYASVLELSGVVVVASLTDAVRAVSAASKPPGTFSADHNRITWRLNDLTLTSEKSQTLIARFQTNGKGEENDAGIQLKFTVPQPPKSTEVFLDGSQVPSVRSLVSGNYSGHT